MNRFFTEYTRWRFCLCDFARERTNFSCVRQFCERSEWNCFD